MNAVIDHFAPLRNSYSQDGEDVIVEDILNKSKCDSRFYIDVGANHPTRLSNTYRSYRQGWRGLTIEPNRKLLALHRAFRPQDIQLAIGCGSVPDVLPFRHSVNHVLSGFTSTGLKKSQELATELLPVMPLDLIVRHLDIAEVAVLSIDVEGFDLEVAKGAPRLLASTRVVVFEKSEQPDEETEFFKSAGFKVAASTKHNLVFSKCG